MVLVGDEGGDHHLAGRAAPVSLAPHLRFMARVGARVRGRVRCRGRGRARARVRGRV